jgi:hypothetical protein
MKATCQKWQVLFSVEGFLERSIRKNKCNMKTKMKHFITAIVIAAFLGLALASDEEEEGNADSTATVSDEQLPQYTAKQYYDLWVENELKAEQLLKGKKIKITGVVDGVGRRVFTEAPYVDLKTGYFIPVTCEFSEKAINTIINLEKGETVTIVGYPENLLEIKRCSIK